MTSVRDIIIIAVILFAVGIAVYFTVDVGHKVNTQLLTTSSINSTPEAVTVLNSADTAINMSDYLYLALFVAFFISIILFGWIIGGYAYMTPIYFVVVILFTFVAVILQLVWIDMATQPEILALTTTLPITNFILSHLGYFIAIMGLVGMLVMFAKPSEV